MPWTDQIKEISELPPNISTMSGIYTHGSQKKVSKQGRKNLCRNKGNKEVFLFPRSAVIKENTTYGDYVVLPWRLGVLAEIVIQYNHPSICLSSRHWLATTYTLLYTIFLAVIVNVISGNTKYKVSKFDRISELYNIQYPAWYQVQYAALLDIRPAG